MKYSKEDLLKINAAIKFHSNRNDVYKMPIFKGMNGFQKHKLYVLGLCVYDEEMEKEMSQ